MYYLRKIGFMFKKIVHFLRIWFYRDKYKDFYFNDKKDNLLSNADFSYSTKLTKEERKESLLELSSKEIF